MIQATRSAAATGERAGLALAAGAGVFGAIALLGSRNPLVLLAVPIAIVGVVVAARRPPVALVILVVLEVTNASGVLGPRGVPVFAASVMLGVIAAGFALRDPVARSRLNAWTAIAVGLLSFYIATQLVATIGSVDMAASLAATRRAALDCLFLLILLILIQLTGRAWAVAAAVVVPFAVLSMLTVINQVVFGGSASFGGFATVTTASGEGVTTLRYGGPFPDPNFWGRHLVMGLPLAAALATRARRSGRRLVGMGWFLAVLAQFIGVYLTQSRGTYVATAVAITVWFIAAGPGIRRWGVAAPPIAALVLAIPGVGNRLLAALSDIMHGESGGHVDPSVLGRVAAQQEAAMMWDERPFFGFGPNTFRGQVINFAGRVAVAVREPTDAPHNMYLQFGAESGSLGLIGLSAVVLGFLAVPVLAIIADPRSADRVLAAGACAAIAGYMMASVALHLSYFRTFAVVLALAMGLAPAWPVPAATVRNFVRGVGVWLAAVLVAGIVFWIALAASESSAYRATQRMTLEPAGPIDGWYAYALDVRSRIEMLSTFAVLLRSGDSPVDIQADPVRGLLTFTGSAATPADARNKVQLAVGQANVRLRKSIGYQQYDLQTIGSMRIADTHEYSRSAQLLSLAGGAGTGLVFGSVLMQLVFRRPADDESRTVPIPLQQFSG